MTDSLRNLSANLNWVVAANAVAGVANLVVVAWFARALGPATMGDYAVVVTAVQLIAAFLSAGFDQAVIRMHGERDLAAAAGFATIGQSLLLVAGSGIVYAIAIQDSPLSAAQLAGPGGVVIGAIVVSFFANLLAAPLAGRLDYRFLAAARLLAMLIGIAAGISAVQAGGGLYGLVVRDALAAVALLVACRLRAGPMSSWRATRSSFRRLFQFARGLWALNIAERLVLRLDYAAVGFLLGKEVLGAYFVVRGLVEGVLGFLLQPIQTVLFAHVCAAERSARRSAILPARAVATLVLAWLVLAIVAGLIGEHTVVLLLGPGYAEASHILPAMVMYAGAVIWFELHKIQSMARLNHDRMVLARVLQMSVFALLVVPFSVCLGLTGASIATAVGAVALAGFASWMAYGPSVRAKDSNPGAP